MENGVDYYSWDTFRSSKFLYGLQTLLVAFVVWVWVKTNKKTKRLSYEEEERIVENYTPEPLVSDVDTHHPRLNPKIVEGKPRRHIKVEGKECLNFCTHNYLGLQGDEGIEEKAAKSVRKYGVGSCGPRGFYGTVDVHLELEARLAKYFEIEEAVVYSYAFSTIASAIPAYCKKRDLVFVDECVNFPIQKGLDASRSEIRYFRHNDMKHLEGLLEEQAKADAKNRLKAKKTRRFLIVEGIYINTGTICPLLQLVELKNKYKLRIFIDESVSFGTLGSTGKGVTEHFGVPIDEIDMIMGSLEASIGSIGGFCVGSTFIVEHQRLSGLGYCFSASLPPLLAVAAIAALDNMEQSPEIITNLQELAAYCHEEFQKSKASQKYQLDSHPMSPLKHIFLDKDTTTNDLQSIVNGCLDMEVAINQSTYLNQDSFPKAPSVYFIINTLHKKEDIDKLIKAIEKNL